MIRALAPLLAALSTIAAATPIELRQEALPIVPVSGAAGIELTGAWRLSAGDRAFGGLSGLAYVEGWLVMLSDAGWLMRWNPVTGEAGDPMPLPGACRGGPVDHAADAEAIALSPDGLELRVALERGARLCAFSWGRDETARSLALDSLPHVSGNRGVEAMATLPGRGTLLLAERGEKDGHRALWFDSAAPDRPGATAEYRAPAGFKPADAAFLPDGRLLILNRRFDLKAGRETALVVADFAPGRPLSGTVIARIARSPLAANYEGMAVQPTASGATIWLVSDDNFSNTRGTMLLQLSYVMNDKDDEL